MNRIYRSLWNDKTGTFVAVSEITQRGKKASTGGGVVGAVFALKALAASLLLAYGATGYALPVGGVVAAGGAAISSNAGSMTVTQTSQNAVLNWQQFNIGQGEAVRFVQPNSSAVALNRVLGADPSSILGSLSANGKVFLVNPNGILFGAGASVNVGGLVASTRNISDSDFMAGNYKFVGSGSGAVVNQGSINADGGYVALLGANVSNDGTISARLGSIALAAGNAITLDVAGDGLINVAIDQGATNALVNNGGMIRADGGHVLLTAQAAGNLLQTAVNNTGVIQAQSIDNHDGTIKLLGDMQSGTVNVGGTLDASAPTGGNGGFIETSAAQVNVSDNTRITTASAMGLNGSWLIDPVDFTIAAGSASLTSSGIGATTLSTSLANGNVGIATGSTTAGNGDIFVNSAVSWAANKLTLSAHRNININANLNASATASLALNFGQGAAAFNNTSNIITNNGAAVNLPAGTTNFSTKQGSDGTVKNYTVITSLGAEGSTTTTDLQGMQGGLSLNYALGASIDASATSGWNSGAGFAPIGAPKFSGSFDGLGHTISNLTINRPTTDNVGLFGYGNSDNTSFPTVVRNVGLVGGSVTGRTNVGGLVGKSNGLIFNSYNTGAVTGSSNVGGLVGTNQWATIDNSYALGTVTGSGNNVGGLVGSNSVSLFGSAIRNSHAAGTVSGSSNVGGLVGSNDSSSLSNSYATGAVTGSGDNIGGLVGTNSSSASIANSYATGAVTSSGNNIGGLVGINNGASITNSYATGAVTGGSYVGGLVGANAGSAGGAGDYGLNGGAGASATIDNSYATGAVSGSSAVGGLVGGNVGGIGGVGFGGYSASTGGAGGAATINHSFAAGAVSGSSVVGGLIGKNVNGAVGADGGGTGGAGGLTTVTNSFWDTTTSGQATSAGGHGMTTAQMQAQANFTTATAANGNANPAWDFTGSWVMYEGHTSPLLRSFMTALTVTAADATKTYDGLAYSGGNGLTYSTTPNMNNLLGTASYSGTAQGAVNAGSYGITAAGLYSNQQGYIINYAAGTLTVNKADLALSGTRTYDGTSAVAGSMLTATGVHGETFAITGSGDTTNLASKNAQTGSTLVNLTGLALGTSGNGGLSGNYNALSTTGSAVTIGKANLTVTGVTVNNKPYDGTTLATLAGGTLAGLISGDTVTLIEAGTFATPNAGNGIAVAAALSLGGPSAQNYTVIQPTGLTANITAPANTNPGSATDSGPRNTAPATTNPASVTDSDLRYQAATASTASLMSAVASQGSTADAPSSTRTGDAPPTVQTFASSTPGGLTGLNLSITGNGVKLPPGVQRADAHEDKD
jgi:filamentous hemagglutinin family protein